ncbi:MAG: hypothetical protein ACRDHL_11785 [Candidatus Promineifilaceae bacterium]
MHAPHDDVPPPFWRELGLAAAAIIGLTLAGIGLISAGAFDPRLIGEQLSTAAPADVQLAPGEPVLRWLAEAPAGDYSVRLSASRAGGETDIGYGVALGDAPALVVAAVAPAGYLALWRGAQDYLDGSAAAPGSETILVWQTWPHVRSGGQSNEIWLDVRAGRLAGLRINRELAWEGSETVPGGRVGVWAQSFGAPAEIDFRLLEIWGLPAGG